MHDDHIVTDDLYSGHIFTQWGTIEIIQDSNPLKYRNVCKENIGIV